MQIRTLTCAKLLPASSSLDIVPGSSLRVPQPEQAPQAQCRLVCCGFAHVDCGKLRITDLGIDRCAQLLQAARSHSSDRRNAAWTGKIIFDLAHVVSKALECCAELPPSKQLYREFFRMGHRISPGQFNYGLGIFAKCETPEQVHRCLESHRSHGAWWNSLSPEDKATHIARRQEAQRRFWERLSPEERAARKHAVRQSIANVLASERGEGEHGRYARTEEISLALKSIERGLTGGTSLRFEGVPDRMRSSWEALFARVVASRKDRFYIYEPMGFPLIDPRNGRIETYHPDFFDYKTRAGKNQVRVIEIKGLLTPTGRRKIELFEKYYLQSDFSDLPDERRALLQRLVATAKEHARIQFQLDLDQRTAFCVFGEHYWRKNERNFVVHSRDSGAAAPFRGGLIPRLAARFPELVPAERAPGFSKSELKRDLANWGLGQETLCAVTPIRAVQISRSLEIPLTSFACTRLYALTNIVHEAQCACVKAGYLTMPDPSPLTTVFNLSALYDMVTTWHGTDASQKKRTIELFAARLKEPQHYLSVYFGQIYLKLIEQSLYEGSMFSFPERHPTEARLFETIRRNASEILARISPLEREGDKKLIRQGADQAQLNQLKRAAVESAGLLANSFADRLARGEIPLDLPFISDQFIDLLKAGYPSFMYIYPTRGSSSSGEEALEAQGLQATEESLKGSDALLLAHRKKFGSHAHTALR